MGHMRHFKSRQIVRKNKKEVTEAYGEQQTA